MTTNLEIKIFDGENWKTIYTYETKSNIKPNEVSINFENDDWKLWGIPEDFIEKEENNEQKD